MRARDSTHPARTALGVVLFLLGGPLLSLLVAWSIAAWMPTRPFAWVGHEGLGPRWPADWEKPPQQVGASHERGVGIHTFRTNAVLYAWNTRPARIRPGLPAERESDDAPRPRLFIAALDGGTAGWPAHCIHWQGSMGVGPALGFDAEFTVTTEMLRERGIIVPPLSDRVSPALYTRIASIVRNTRPIPVAVLWPGLIANSAFWGALLVCVVFGPRFVRRWRRHRHGACVECGYTLTRANGDQKSLLAVCPECGSANGGPEASASIGSPTS